MRTCVLLIFTLLGWAQHVVAGVTPWVDFEIRDGHVLIPTSIEGIDGMSLIDTGAQVSFIERSFMRLHNLKFGNGRPMKIMGVGSSEMRKTFSNVPVRIMGTELNFKVLVEGKLLNDTQLLIGGDFLSQLYFQFDYPNKRFRGITRDTFELKKIRNVESKLDPATRQPMVKVRLNDEKDVWLVMDTGNSGGVLLKRRVATRRGWLDEFDTEVNSARGVVGALDVETFRLPVLAIGPYDVKNARVTVPQEGKRFDIFQRQRGLSDIRSKTQGLLGYDVWKNFLVTIDYRSGALFIEIPQKAEADEPAS